MGKLINANKEEFQSIIDSETNLVLVDFWAEWCPPCKALGPVLHDVSEEVDNVTILKVNVEETENSELSASFGVRGIPTVIAFQDGEQVDRFVGLIPKEKVIEFIERNTKSEEAETTEETTNESED